MDPLSNCHLWNCLKSTSAALSDWSGLLLVRAFFFSAAFMAAHGTIDFAVSVFFNRFLPFGSAGIIAVVFSGAMGLSVGEEDVGSGFTGVRICRGHYAFDLTDDFKIVSSG